MAMAAKLVRDGIEIRQGTPTEPIRRATLFLKMWRVRHPNGPERTLATLTVVRPGREGYVIKELLPEMDSAPEAAVDKAVAIAKAGDVTAIFVNADLADLPPLRFAAAG